MSESIDKELYLDSLISAGRFMDTDEFESLTGYVDGLEERIAELKTDAKRYQVIRKHTIPAHLAHHLHITQRDIPEDETIEDRIDSLIDEHLEVNADG